MLSNLVNYYCKVLLTPKNLLFISICFLLNVIIVLSAYSSLLPMEYIKAIDFLFIFPINLQLDSYRWILLLLPFLLISHSLINNSFRNSPVYFLIRMENFLFWFHSLFIGLFIFTSASLLIGIFVSAIAIFLISLPVDAQVSSELFLQTLNINSSWLLLIHIYFVYLLTIFLLVLLNVIVGWLFDNATIGFLITIVLVFFSIFTSGINMFIFQWNPLASALYLEKKLDIISLFTQYTVLILCIGLLYFLTAKYFYKNHEKVIKI
ncbi:hypothetical protein [Bacillus kwashiorkori]|uniref:hypothetical protein n=1 Tax=Bacillus kwashiorkori TaxID=1522318 RepID=UPI0007854864|nr:hypothetical protein [Bacillus kwashiorkori]